MSLWIQILNAAASGDQETACRLLNIDLVEELRFHVVTAEPDDCAYDGPLVKAVMNFIYTLRSTSDYEMARSRSEDFIDYVTDLIIAKVRRTMALIAFCYEFPNLGLTEVVDSFPGWDGLKRSSDMKLRWVSEHLNSMNAVGVSVPTSSRAILEAIALNTDEILGFNERALVKKWKVDRSWEDFKEREELGKDYICIDGGDERDQGLDYESFDYGTISESKFATCESSDDIENLFDWQEIALAVTHDLEEILKEFHVRRPTDGFRPIAWHNVWWYVRDEYPALPLILIVKEPNCDVDAVLAEYITQTYPDVLKVTRLNIQRRRTSLSSVCQEHVIAVLRERLTTPGYVMSN